MSTLQFYIERAADCRGQADATKLQNVRARCLSAADAWDEMAGRVRRTQIYREEEEARKAETSSQALQSASNAAPDRSRDARAV